MKVFLRGLAGAGSAATGTHAKAMRIDATPQPLHYTLSAFRWHMDTRQPCKAIAVHDYLSTSAAWEQMLNESIASLPLSRLTPTEPLEVYSVDLRGHGFSEGVALARSESLVQAAAADVALLRRDVLQTEAKLTGIGFGAMVACQAALHSPDHFSTLVLFVRHFSQLFECDPADYALRTVLQSAPSNATSLHEVNNYLKNKVPNPEERSVLLSAVEEKDGRARFRFSKELTAAQEKFVLSADASDAVFPKPVYVFVTDTEGKPPTEAALARFQVMFPQTKLMELSAQGETVGPTKASLVPIMLQYFNLLGEVSQGTN